MERQGIKFRMNIIENDRSHKIVIVSLNSVQSCCEAKLWFGINVDFKVAVE